MVPKHQPHSKFGRWLLKYRLKVIFISFITLIPLMFIIALYVGDYLKYNNVDFDGQIVSKFQSSSISIEDVTNYNIINLETDEIFVQIKLIDYLTPEYYDDTNGHYTFVAASQVKSGRQINGLTAKFIVQSKWLNAKSAVTNIPLTTAFSSNRIISFNHVLPQSPLWFVTVTDPYLYVELTYNVSFSMGSDQEVKHYFKTYLGDVIPTKLTDKDKENEPV